MCTSNHSYPPPPDLPHHFVCTANHSYPPQPDLLMDTFCVDFQFGYIKSPPPFQELDLLMENLDTLCALHIWLHQITFQELELLIENLDILCGLQIWQHQITPPKNKQNNNSSAVIAVYPKVNVSLYWSIKKKNILEYLSSDYP